MKKVATLILSTSACSKCYDSLSTVMSIVTWVLLFIEGFSSYRKLWCLVSGENKKGKSVSNKLRRVKLSLKKGYEVLERQSILSDSLALLGFSCGNLVLTNSFDSKFHVFIAL